MKPNRYTIPENTLINDRYKIVSVIGQGGVGTTYKALDIKSKTRKALKALEIERIENLKELELFEREITVLKSIDHLKEFSKTTGSN